MDALLGGRVALVQPRHGYRVNVDSLLLAAFAAQGRPARLAVDLGAGTGALGLVLFAVRAARTVALVENDADLVAIASENLGRNRTPGMVVAWDVARGRPPQELVQRAELVVCNPPFFPPSSGTPAREGRVRRARSGSLEPFLRAAQAILGGPRARAAFCYPAAGLVELLNAGRASGLVPKRLRLVHPHAGDAARLALVELRIAKPGGLLVEPPLVEWEGRTRSSEVAGIVAGSFGPKPSPP
jgi:tRNA1Val (adenine37-N6)-methyltransferase